MSRKLIKPVMSAEEAVKHVKPGDIVVLHWRKGLGIEGAPPSYKWRGQKLNAGWIATFNEYAIVAENRDIRLNALMLGIAIEERPGHAAYQEQFLHKADGPIARRIDRILRLVITALRAQRPLVMVFIHPVGQGIQERINVLRTDGKTA